ncbi:hypothetical protein [Tenacibaculum ovolyticum]|uniref:hypothetical protein n=1 Tax=Tenacibaculum ovolyticum TaxID=104270 RepID=UPI003BA93EA5
MKKGHSFHIPVMGIGFTIDTPIKVAQYGIDSVIFISDDILLEKMRKMYSSRFKLPYTEIGAKEEDSRAKRITSYLNLIKEVAEKKLENIKNASIEKSNELKKYFSMLPDSSTLKQDFIKLTDKITDVSEIKKWLNDNLSLGDINVNIMTKLDKVNYNPVNKKETLPIEFNDAHAALRGFANSNLNSSMVFSAGMNPRLFTYLEKFDDFFPDINGVIKKKVVIKVSDYRSALIQGKFLAKKGIWVSEYRIESGLNCGGHAFATEGFLMGPILEEFKKNRNELINSVYDLLVNALETKGKSIPTKTLTIKVTAQGGVGTAEEQEFLISNYGLDSVGWGSPFLLVPEATTVDNNTLKQLQKAKEKDLFLSNISPLGVPFNNLRGNTKDIQKLAFIAKGRPGSSCPKKFLALDGEFSEKTICTASRQYQHLKIKQLEDKKASLSDIEYQKEYANIVDKSCICVGLGTAALVVNDMDTKVEGEGVSICPGPNMAYYSKEISLSEMVGHIYGKNNVIERVDRPNVFVKELGLYLDYLKTKIDETTSEMNKKQEKYLVSFSKNLNEGIHYYKSMFLTMKSSFEDTKHLILKELNESLDELNLMNKDIDLLILNKIKA